MAAPGVWGDEFLVNSVTNGAQLSPVIAGLSGGGFAIAFTDYSHSSSLGFTDVSGTAVRVQLFDSAGHAQSNLIQVNTTTSFDQSAPRIAGLDDGGFVIAYSDDSHGWYQPDPDYSEEAVRMQRFSASGEKLNSEVRVNTTLDGAQDFPNVTRLENGRFLVTWDDGSDPNTANVKAQLFSADGSFIGSEFRINAGTVGGQTGSDIAALANGGFAVTFVDGTGADGDGGGIYLRLFGADGTPQGGDIAVNTATVSDQFTPSITALTGGGLFVTWTDGSFGSETGNDDPSSYAVRGQVFDAQGTKVGSEILVNATTANGQLQPFVLALSDGRFVVTWSDTSQGTETGGDDPEFGAIRARIFNADGSVNSDEFLVNATTTGHQNEPQIAQLTDGRLAFTWTDYSYGAETGGDDPENAAIRARLFTPDAVTGGTSGGVTGGTGGSGGTGDNVDNGDTGGTGDTGGSGGSGDSTPDIERGLYWYGSGRDENKWGTLLDDTLKGGSGADTLIGSSGNDQIYGGSGRDSLKGSKGDDVLRGNRSSDKLLGCTGDDTIRGGRGSDTLIGGTGDDDLAGNNGYDVLDGGHGADTLSGGGHRDVFIFDDKRDSLAETGQSDTITDFKDGTDLIDLSAFGGLRFLDHTRFTGHGGEVRYISSSSHATIKIDTNGDGRIDMRIELEGGHDLSVDDFIL